MSSNSNINIRRCGNIVVAIVVIIKLIAVVVVVVVMTVGTKKNRSKHKW